MGVQSAGDALGHCKLRLTAKQAMVILEGFRVLLVWVELSRHRPSGDTRSGAFAPVLGCVQSSPAPPSDTSHERLLSSFRGVRQAGGPSVLVAVMAVVPQDHCGLKLLRTLLREMMSSLGFVGH